MRCLERSPTDRMLAFAVTALSWFAGAPTAEAALMEPIAGGLVTRRVEVAPKSMKSCDANARVSTEQTRTVPADGGPWGPSGILLSPPRLGPSRYASAWKAFSNARLAGVWKPN